MPGKEYETFSPGEGVERVRQKFTWDAVARELEQGTAPLSWALAGARWKWLAGRILAALLLIVLMITRPQGLLGTRELSLDWVRRHWRRLREARS